MLFCSLIDNGGSVYIGHSWGAQVGLLFLDEPGWVDGFVSMETTLEFRPKADSNRIMELWPEHYQKFVRNRTRFDIPMLFLANTEEDESFWIFENISSKSLIHAGAKEKFGHESHTSGFHLRSFLDDQYEQPDRKAMQRQFELYIKHLEMIHSFFRESSMPDLDDFRSEFYIHHRKK